MINPQLVARILPIEAPFWDRTVTLGIIIDGQMLTSHAKGEKKELLNLAPQAQCVLATWHGQYRSDMFIVPRERWEAEARSTLK